MNVSSGSVNASQSYFKVGTVLDLKVCCFSIVRNLEGIKNSENKIVLKKTSEKTQKLFSILSSRGGDIAKCMGRIKNITQTFDKEVASYQLAGSDKIKKLTKLTENLVNKAVNDVNFQSLSSEKQAKHHPGMPSKALPDNTLTPSGAPTDNQAISSGDNRFDNIVRHNGKSTFYLPRF